MTDEAVVSQRPSHCYIVSGKSGVKIYDTEEKMIAENGYMLNVDACICPIVYRDGDAVLALSQIEKYVHKDCGACPACEEQGYVSSKLHGLCARPGCSFNAEHLTVIGKFVSVKESFPSGASHWIWKQESRHEETL